jgi:isoleucyl-tRNA synthetase
VFASEGADTLRFYLLGNDQAVGGDYMRFSRDAMRDISRNVFGTLWNTLSFLTMYAEIDGWEPGKAYKGGKLAEPESENVLDRWIVARLNEVIGEMTEAADAYQLARALRPLRGLVDDLSNWYVRRSRRRFWKSEDDGDKAAAYVTLHYVLSKIAQLLAPWSPFVADKLWRELTAGMDEARSVHLSDWPTAGEVDAEVLEQMSMTREVVTTGLSFRALHKVKVRQPLAKVTITLPGKNELNEEMQSIVREELNVKRVVMNNHKGGGNLFAVLDTKITPELKAEGMMRDVVRQVQQARKEAGLDVSDRIVLVLETEAAELASAVAAHAEAIKAETLAVELRTEGASDQVPVKVEGEKLYIAVRRVSK